MIRKDLNVNLEKENLHSYLLASVLCPTKKTQLRGLDSRWKIFWQELLQKH